MSRKKSLLFASSMLVILFSFSCLNTIAEVKNWMEVDAIEAITGKYHVLDNDGIKVYLPEVFERYSSVEYQVLLDSLMNIEDFEFESKRLKSLRELEGSFYLFFDNETHSTYTINTLPYMPITKTDAKYLLGMISASNARTAQNTDLSFTKLTAKYHGTKNQHIFRTIHRIDNSKTKAEIYNVNYIVTSKNKTVWIQLTTPFKVDFDMFIQKMIM